MKLKLSLTNSELSALLLTARRLCRLQTDLDFIIYSHVTTLELFILKHGQKFVTGSVKRKNRITLTDIETIAFYDLLRVCIDDLPTYEELLALNIIERIERQHDNQEAIRMSIRNTTTL